MEDKMKIVRLTKRLGQTINMPKNSQVFSITLQAEVTAEFDSDNEKYEDVDKALFEAASQSIQADKQRIREARKDKQNAE